MNKIEGVEAADDVRESARIDIDYMRRALEWADKGDETDGASPIGCVIVLDGKVVGEGYNETEMLHDPTAHAEITAIRRACTSLQADDLRGATLYTTLQPCGMCTMASIWAKIDRIVFGAGRDDVHEMYFEERDRGAIDYVLDAYKDDMKIEGGILSKACAVYYAGPDDDVPESEQVNK